MNQFYGIAVVNDDTVLTCAGDDTGFFNSSKLKTYNLTTKTKISRVDLQMLPDRIVVVNLDGNSDTGRVLSVSRVFLNYTKSAMLKINTYVDVGKSKINSARLLEFCANSKRLDCSSEKNSQNSPKRAHPWNLRYLPPM